MTIRKPGDYVVNDELTEKELQWFVQDCVASGGEDRSRNCSEYPLTGWNRIVNDIHGRNTFFIEDPLFRANNVTLEYKNKTMPKRKPGDYVENSQLTPLEREQFVEDCLKSGFEDVRDSNMKCESYFTTAAQPNGDVVANSGFVSGVEFNNVTHEYAQKGANINKDKRIEELEQRVAQLEKQCIENTEPKDEPVTEDHIGRLVMVRNYDDQDWKGPIELSSVDGESVPYPYKTVCAVYSQAKLYKGPTKPNWIEHDGMGVPEEVEDAGKALVQKRNGWICVVDEYSPWWIHDDVGGEGGDIVRYTIIEP